MPSPRSSENLFFESSGISYPCTITRRGSLVAQTRVIYAGDWRTFGKVGLESNRIAEYVELTFYKPYLAAFGVTLQNLDEVSIYVESLGETLSITLDKSRDSGDCIVWEAYANQRIKKVIK